jgi:hypothetical protein
MATRKTSHAQQSTPGESPFATLPGADVWRSMMEAQTERFEQMLAEMERLEKERHERAVSAIDDVAKLVKSGIDYQQQLTEQWRKLGLDAARKSAQMMGTIQG